MAFEYSISSEDGLVYIRFHNATDITEILKSIKEVVFDDEFRPEYKVLIEIQAHYVPIVDEMREFIRLLIQLRTQFKNKIAVAVTERMLREMTEAAKSYVHRKTDIQMELFDRAEDAYEWLNR